jgi:hypothetical protein
VNKLTQIYNAGRVWGHKVRLTRQDVQALCNRYYIENTVPELMGMLDHVYTVDPLKAIVEIGVCFGGSLKIWERVIPEDGIVIGVEKRSNILALLTGQEEEGRSHKRTDWEAEWFENGIIKLRSSREVYVVVGDSAHPETALKVSKLLGERRIDFWFHDGMHFGPTPVYDYFNYQDMIRPEGLVCVADVNNIADRTQWVENSGCQALAIELPQPKIPTVQGHSQGMCMWRKQDGFPFDPASVVKKYNLRVNGPNASGNDPSDYYR